MPPRSGHRPRPPLDPAKLDELALQYVGKFATSRGKLIAYLRRKLRERGWSEVGQPDPEGVADRLVRLGYVDDAAFALSKARVMTGRGLGGRRISQALHVAGIAEDDRIEAEALTQSQRAVAALRFAKRRRIGPFGKEPIDPRGLEKALAAMIRAGHDFALARAIVHLPPGAEVDQALLDDLP